MAIDFGGFKRGGPQIVDFEHGAAGFRFPSASLESARVCRVRIENPWRTIP